MCYYRAYMDTQQLLNTACNAAGEAAAEVMNIYTREFSVEEKEDKSPITEADRSANRIIEKHLRGTGYPILSEESADDVSARRSSQRVWIVDPLDGTQDFVEKTGDFVIMIGLVEEGRPILGVCFAPAYNKLYFAAKGQGAFITHNGETARLSVSDVAEISDARVVVSRSHYSDKIKHMLEGFDHNKAKRAGSNGLKIGMVAEGSADVFFNPTHKMGEWDQCAPHIILEEAGGKITDMDGQALVYNKEIPRIPNGVIATNGVLHERMHAALERAM